MTNKHEKKFIINMLIGFVLTTGGISCIIYASFTDEHQTGLDLLGPDFRCDN